MAARKSTTVKPKNIIENDIIKTNTSGGGGGSAKKLHDFLQQHFIKKDNPENKVIEKTNTRIGDKTLKILGGSYHIPDEEYYAFLRIYHEEVIKGGATEYLTEKQLSRGGPILIDIDFRYDTPERKFTKDHIVDLICLYLEELKKMYQIDDSVTFPIFVLEKPSVLEVKKGDSIIYKDGIHMMIGLQADRVVQQVLRKHILEKVGDMWSDINITNTWENAFDDAVTKGHANWQLVGSKKPTSDAYRLAYVFHISVDPQDKELMMPEVPIDLYLTNSQNFLKMSARYRDHPVFFMKPDFVQIYNEVSSILGVNGTAAGDGNAVGPGVKTSSSSMNLVMPSVYGSSTDMSRSENARPGFVVENVLRISNRDELNRMVQGFLESLTPTEFELKEVYDYTMALPNTYYGTGSFDKWIRVGWALHNISQYLFLVWVAFSAQAPDFSYSNIRTDLWQRWSSFDTRSENGLTKRSIMYWLKQDNPEKHKTIRDNSVEHMIDLTLESCVMTSSLCNEKAKPRGSGDYDIAVILYHLFRDEYKCVSITGNLWYHFNNHRWKKIDSGTSLRKAISNELRDIYTSKMSKLIRQKLQLRNTANANGIYDDVTEGDADAEGAGGEIIKRIKSLQKRIDMIVDIIQRLSKTNDKKNIMTEAKELFYDPMFMEKLDQNPYLLCFKNGVIDFKEKRFRRGLPEDYLSQCTNIDYIQVDPTKHASILSEIHDFMNKLFPNEELKKYMWDHLASTLIGNNMNQTFNMYIGIGQNGKSVLINLMEHILGDYKKDVPLSLLTQQRTRIGGLAPEIVSLKGARYAVMQEPSKGDRINEGIMKQITGGDPIQARAPYMPEMVTFIPQFKLVVCLNVMMELYSQDHGTRRRIRVVEFESLFTENPVENDPDKPFQYKLDKTIKEKFDAWKEVFAAMLVEIAYERMGNVPDCDKVMSASNTYLNKQDYVGEFITECVEPYEHGCLMKQELIAEFRDWYTNNFTGKLPNSRDVVDAIEKKYGKLQSGVWRGLRLKPKASIHGSGGGSHHRDDGSISTHSTGLSGNPELDCQIQEL